MNCPNDTHEIRQFVKHHQAHDDCTCEQLKQWVLELCDRLDEAKRNEAGPCHKDGEAA